MREESREIKLSLGTVNLEEKLGAYYIDMRPARIHYEDNIYSGGFDDDGVPTCGINGEQVYLPVNIAQYGFMLHADYLENPDTNTLKVLHACINRLIDISSEYKNSLVWWHNFKNEKYNIPAPWASAMAQGEIISLFLRYYQVTNDSYYLELALKTYQFLLFEDKEISVREIDEDGNLWFQEYPSKPSSYVLNGFVYTVFGLFDLFRVTELPQVKKDLNASLKTLIENIHRFDAGYWSYYDLDKYELVRFYYQQNVHVPQMEILYLLTGEPIFKKYKLKWEKQINPFNYKFVQLMYRLWPRLRAKKLILR